MKAHPNIVLIQSFFEYYGQSDLDGIRTVLSENIRWHIPGTHSLSGTKTGIDAVLQYFESLTKASFQASSIVMGVNDDYVIDCHRNWSNLEGEENLDNMSCLLWKIQDQKIVEVYNFPQDQHKVDQFFERVYGVLSK